MPPKSKKVQEKINSPKSISPKNKTKRCPKGEQRNPKTGVCEKRGDINLDAQKPKKMIEIRKQPKNLSKMTTKEKDIYEKRKSCIDTYRNKLPSLIHEIEKPDEFKQQDEYEESNKSEKSPESESLKSKTPSPKNKQKRCPKGQHRNPKTGICEKKGEKNI